MAKWKGLILAGGTGSRLYPLTHVTNKHLLPVYDKPMVYYPLTTLMLGGIRDFVIVSLPEMLPQFEQLLGTGERWGLSFSYVPQDEPKGIAHGAVVAESELAGCNVALILGDNIFYGTGLPAQIRRAMEYDEGATIFGYEVTDASQFGVVELDGDGNPVSIVEKPKQARMKLAVPGLYFYDAALLEIVSTLQPSARGELEITDVNRAYLERGNLRVMPMGRGTAWLDGGTHQDLFEAGQFVKVLEDRTGLKIACPEEVAYRMEYISRSDLMELADIGVKSQYFDYIKRIAEAG